MIPNRYLVLIGAGVALVVLGAAWFGGRRALEAVNPLNPENVFSEGADQVVTVLTGRDETLGGWLAEWFDPATREVGRLYGPGNFVQSNPVELTR